MQLIINNKEIEATKGELIIDAAYRNGIDIPALCYASGYQHQPSCLVCVVKNCQTGQIIPSCSTVVTEGMAIEVECDEVIAIRLQSLELLLSDHISVCRSPCNVKKCKLRRFAIEYNAKWNRYPRYSAIKETPLQHVKNNLWFDVAKCIKCGLCVYNSNDGFTFQKRGFEMQVVLPEESVKNVDEKLWEICPTQSLMMR
jgi:NADH dehydrogenase/NADH:ubiquinone oxidoreductase subunit G